MFVFANGCFWGSEKGVWRLPGGGIHSTAVGYAGGFTPNPTYEDRIERWKKWWQNKVFGMFHIVSPDFWKHSGTIYALLDVWWYMMYIYICLCVRLTSFLTFVHIFQVSIDVARYVCLILSPINGWGYEWPFPSSRGQWTPGENDINQRLVTGDTCWWFLIQETPMVITYTYMVLYRVSYHVG